MKPESLRRRSCLLLVSVVVLQAAFLMGLPASSGSDPDVVDNLDGTKTATWDLDDPLNYSHSGVSVSGGVAELERVNVSFTDTTEGDFLDAEADHNISIDGGNFIELSGNSGDLISVGDFSSSGPWSDGTTPDITTGWNGTAENAFLKHSSGEVDVQFDSMDDIAGTGWSGTVSPGAGVTPNQETTIVIEGPGSLNVSYVPNGDPTRWGGVERGTGGNPDWSAYNRVVFRGNTTYTGSDLLIFVNLSDGVEQSLSALQMFPGWRYYSFSLLEFTGDLSSIATIRVLATNVTVPVLFYVDDIRLTFHKSFGQTAYINQTFVKPDPTSGQPHGVVLTFDYLVETVQGASLYNATVRVNNSGSDFTWNKTFVSTQQWTSMYFDLSSYMMAADTYQISLSLHLIVDTSAACQADLRFDNVSIIWPDYNDGWLASQVFDASFNTTWENISWVEGTQDPAYNVSVRTRTGDTYPPNGSWSPWSLPLTNSSGEPIQDPSAKYIQYNISLTTTNASLTPFVNSVTISGWQYSPTGFVRTMDFTPAEPLVGWREFNASHAIPPACDITYWYWDDIASNWISTTPGASLSALTAQNITIRANLMTTDTTVTPQLYNMSLDYEFLGALDHIVIDPTFWSGTAEDVHDFDATAYDAYGHVLSMTFTWTTTDVNGSVDPNGMYVPHDAGSWIITASAGGLWANATVDIAPALINSLEITPASWAGTTDESVDFDCRGYDNKSNEVVITPVWNTTDPLGIVGVTGIYYPGSANTSGSVWTVYCNDTNSSMSASVQVTVTPGALRIVRVFPWSLGTITTDDNITLYCYGYDFFDNFIGPVNANWSLSGNFGTISPERRNYAVFDPILAVSVGNITARHDDNLSAVTDDFLIVPGALATLEVIPDTVDLKVGQKQVFLAVGYDGDGNEVEIAPIQVVWTSNVGSVTQNELKAQTISDSGWMNATVSGVTASASVRVRALAPPIWDVLFFPWSAFILIVVLAVLIFAWRSIREMYAVEDMFIVGNEGRLIAHRTRRLHADRDEDILAGMLTAIQEFIRDSFREDDQLRTFEFGEKKILIAKGSHIYAAAFFAGNPPRWAESTMAAFVTDFETRYGFHEKKWSGDVTSLEDLDEMMALIVGVKKYKEGDWERKLK
ncbi:MAG: hypothetical protein LN415_08195 [Candidatus Thermoplasmatota archaeon]|nr:hypothetical protein [Candidatus Thermoplasmatota archaeon]